jgi:hypothetical protein
MIDFNLIREKFESGEYQLENVPSIIHMDEDGISINSRVSCINEPEYIDGTKVASYNLTNKLKATSAGEWEADISIIRRDCFSSRSQLNELFGDNIKDEDNQQVIERITLQQACKLIKVKLKSNFDYYTQNKLELEKDLSRQVLEKEVIDVYLRKKLENELFYKQMCTLFDSYSNDDSYKPNGDNSLYERSFILNDFHILVNDCYTIQATAQRGDYYFLFDYLTG